MPLVTTTLPDITQSVVRPVSVDVSLQVKEWTRIADSVPLYYLNDQGQLSAAGTGLDNKDDRLARMNTKRRIEVSTEFRDAEDMHITDVTGKSGNIRFFEDRPLNMWVAAAYTSTIVDMEFTYLTDSKEEARRWGDDISARYRQGRFSLEHQITYSYTLPPTVWQLIAEVYEKREAKGGYGETYAEWFNKCTTNRMLSISNETGSHSQLAVSEKQDRIQGFFNFNHEPTKPEHDASTGLWSIKFTYTFTYQRPSTVDMKYPVIVHQQLLSRPFIEFVNRGIAVDDRAVRRDQFLWGMKPFEGSDIQRIMKPKFPFIRIPYMDDFAFNYAFPGTGAYLTVLLQQEKDERIAFNLRELGDIILDHDILDFLAQGEWQYIGMPGKSIFHFDLLRGTDLCTAPAVTLDADLNVILHPEIDVRKEYRVRCAVFTDLSYVDRDALDRLMAHPKAFQKVFAAMNDILRIDSSFQKLGDQRRIEPWQLSKLYECIAGQGSCNIYSGITRSWGMNAHGTTMTNTQRTFMSDIPDSVLKAFRQHRRTRMDSQVFGIAFYDKYNSKAVANAKARGLA